MSSVKRIYALAVRSLKEILRDPISLVFLYAMPLCMLVLFYYIFSGLTEQFSMKYLAPSMVVFGQTFIALFMGSLMAGDRASSFITRLYTTEIRSYEFVLGYALAALPVSLSQTALFLLVAALIDFSFFSAGLFLCVLFGLVTALLYIAFGLLFGTVCTEKSVGGIASILVTLQSVLSGMWFPTEGMSEGFVNFMKILPFKNGTDLMMSVAEMNFSFSKVVQPALIVLAYALVVLVAAIFAYAKKMKR
ncbi:MAG: ABC transporter permease [Clostridia bacterium]|nr:ABC transporter permease [Clostridia bacterium]